MVARWEVKRNWQRGNAKEARCIEHIIPSVEWKTLISGGLYSLVREENRESERDIVLGWRCTDGTGCLNMLVVNEEQSKSQQDSLRNTTGRRCSMPCSIIIFPLELKGLVIEEKYKSKIKRLYVTLLHLLVYTHAILHFLGILLDINIDKMHCFLASNSMAASSVYPAVDHRFAMVYDSFLWVTKSIV